MQYYQSKQSMLCCVYITQAQLINQKLMANATVFIQHEKPEKLAVYNCKQCSANATNITSNKTNGVNVLKNNT